jgi:hypothetical protein
VSFTRTAFVVQAAALVATIVACSHCASASSAAPVVPATGPGAWFVNTGCTGCHTVSVYGLGKPGATGPDLALAVEDVPRRFGRSLEDFLQAPIGTMGIVLSTRIQLDDQQKKRALEELRTAYALARQRR